MDAIKFIHERNRMCATYTPKRCKGCPADNYGERDTSCIMIDKIDAEKVVSIVDKWSSEHPLKTRQSVFLEQWPNCMIDTNGVVGICPRNVDNKCICDLELFYDCRSCDLCRREFWMQEVE